MHRRHFLNASATATAGATVLGALDIGRFARAAGSDMIKLGLIGCGGRGSGAASDALTADAGTKLWAMADVFADKIDASAATLKGKFAERIDVDASRRHAGLDGYRAVIEGSDVVLIACASRFHGEYGLAAVKAGKHVFVEKPAAVDVVGVQKIEEADALSKKNGTGFLAGVTYRYHPGRREAVARMRAGEIGEIVAVQCDYMRSPYRTIQRDPAWGEMEYQFRNWYHFSWLSGDDIPQSLIHNLDSALWALGDEMPELAYGMGGRSTHFETMMGTSFDHHSVIYEYPDGRRIYAACRTATGCHGSNRDVFHGSKGRCYYSSFAPPQITDLKGNITWKAEQDREKRSPYEREHLEFLQSIRAGKPLQCAKVLADSTMATILGQVAAYSGKMIRWKELVDSRFAFPPAGDIRLDMEPPVKPGPDGIYPVAVPGVTKFL